MTHHQTWNIRVVPGRVAPAKAVGGETPLDHAAARQTRPPQEREGWSRVTRGTQAGRPGASSPGAPWAGLAAPPKPADTMPETKPRGDSGLRYHANSGHQRYMPQGRPSNTTQTHRKRRIRASQPEKNPAWNYPEPTARSTTGGYLRLPPLG